MYWKQNYLGKQVYHGIIVPWGLFVGFFVEVLFGLVFLILSKAVSDFKALVPY